MTDITKVHKPKVKETRYKHFWVFLVFIMFVVAIIIIWRSQPYRLTAPDGSKIVYELRDSDAERIRGLSGRSTLGNDSGMLFDFFSTADNRCFWMKGMKFSIDMVWLDSDKKVVYAKYGATPESFPETFCPHTASRYVLEVPSGQAVERGFVIGAQAKF